MSPARLFIRRPVASLLAAVALLLAGLIAFARLPVAPLPQVDFPVIQINAALPGASPASMAATVATPLERALGSIPGVASINSHSSQGTTQIWLEFAPDRDLDSAARDVQAAINAARGELPLGMPGNPAYRKISPSQAPILALALSSSQLSPSELYNAAATTLAQRLAQVDGVGQVTIEGASLPAVRIQLQPGALAQYGIALDEVRRAIVEANPVAPLGLLEEDAQRWQVTLGPALRTAADYGALVVRLREGAAVRLRDVAILSDSVENRYSRGFHNDHTAVILTVNRQTNANTVATIDAIKAQLPALRALVPAAAELKVVMDRSPAIHSALREAGLILFGGLILVVALAALTLGGQRAALVPAAVLPVVLIGTGVALYFCGFSLNNLSLMALIVALGLVVDDALVVVESTRRHLARGLPPRRAALRAVHELGFALVAMNLTLVVVFLSILLLGGLAERLFREFSITLVAALVLSLLVSLSLTPSLCARLLRRPPSAPAAPSLLGDVARAHAVSLDWVLARGWVVVLLLAVLAGAAGLLFNRLPKILLPEQDTGQLSGFVRGDDSFSFQIMQPKIEEFRHLLLADPAVDQVFGASGTNGVSNAWLRASLKPMEERRVASAAVVDRLRRQMPKVPGGILNLAVDQDIRLASPFNRSPYELLMLSSELGPLQQWAAKVTKTLEQLPEVIDVDGVRDGGTQQVILQIDRTAAARLGVDMAMVAALLNNAFSQRQVSTLYDEFNQYRVVMELEPGHTQSPAVLEQLPVITAAGPYPHLPALVTASLKTGCGTRGSLPRRA